MSEDYSRLRITTNSEELTEGLFGQIILHVFEVLPKLYDERIFPCWDIRSLKYGCAPDYTVIPGLLEINYALKAENYKEVNLRDVRRKNIVVLGSDWEYMNMLWSTYFRIPHRVVEKAEGFGDMSNALALHYRGTDKNLAVEMTQSVSYNDILLLVEDFLEAHQEVDHILLATDEFAFFQKAQAAFGREKVINTGEVEFWDSHNTSETFHRGNHAILDCLLLSRCKYLIKCHSALSGFAKVLNPDLKCYRISASKMFVDIPYFPDAYIPRMVSNNPKCQKILSRLFRGDWLDDPKARERFGKPFRTMEREQENTKSKSMKDRIKRKLSFLAEKLH